MNKIGAQVVNKDAFVKMRSHLGNYLLRQGRDGFELN